MCNLKDVFHSIPQPTSRQKGSCEITIVSQSVSRSIRDFLKIAHEVWVSWGKKRTELDISQKSHFWEKAQR